jgi:hypothetical protein
LPVWGEPGMNQVQSSTRTSGALRWDFSQSAVTTGLSGVKWATMRRLSVGLVNDENPVQLARPDARGKRAARIACAARATLSDIAQHNHARGDARAMVQSSKNVRICYTCRHILIVRINFSASRATGERACLHCTGAGNYA